jgi:hypothetical protein
VTRQHLRTHAWHESRAFSSAVKITGGSLVFLAGITPVDEQRQAFAVPGMLTELQAVAALP